MTLQWIGALAAVALTAVAAIPSQALAQQAPRTAGGCSLADPAAFHACALEKMKTFTPPRTADGVPNLEGYWDRAYTSQDIEEHGSDGLNTQAGPSIIVDTPDRRIPYQPWALALKKDMVARYISPLAACLPPGVPRYVIAPGAHRILQRPGYIAHLLEFSHSYRVIPTTPRPHVGSGIRLYLGDSRGRWEGHTLVVDVTNANGLTWIDNAGNFFSDALHVVERYTMIDADAIHYQATIEDPKVYTRPWTMVSALLRNREPGFQAVRTGVPRGQPHDRGEREHRHEALPGRDAAGALNPPGASAPADGPYDIPGIRNARTRPSISLRSQANDGMTNR